jgi:membrane-associated phospholipid phosphatase
MPARLEHRHSGLRSVFDVARWGSGGRCVRRRARYRSHRESVYPKRRTGKPASHDAASPSAVPLIALAAVALVAGAAGYVAAWRVHGLFALDAAAAVGRHDRAGRLRRHLARRRDPEVLSGLALTLAAVALVACGVAVGVLAALVHRSEWLRDVDHAVARWGHVHASSAATTGLRLVTDLASTPGAAAIVVVAAVVEMFRLRSRWLVPFLLVVVLGDSAVTNAVKHLAERARPTIDPAAAALGPSFPSGHSSTAAAMFAAIALLAGRGRGRRARALLVAAAVALAVAVAASRVLLDLHWTSDVLAGLALGWAWFAACAIAFGGRLLRPAAPVEAAARATPSQSGARLPVSTRR